MNRETMSKLHPQHRERNQKIASILTLLITIAAKIEKIKQKICGFSSQQFSPESVFEALDLTNKGYLDIYDIKQFLSNDSIQDQDILRLLLRFGGTTSQPKMTYLGYLQLLKPHFHVELGRDLLMRDTMTRRAAGNIERLTHQTLLLLVNELLLINCICIAEHEEMKAVLMEEYMLNQLELAEILGVNHLNPLKAIHQFIDCHSDYAVEEKEVKFLLAYLRVAEYQLPEEPIIRALFMPTVLSRGIQTQYQKTATRIDHNQTQRQKMHQNYDKKYLGPKDLLNNTQKMTFLNYVHPNSYQPTRDVQPQSAPKNKQYISMEQPEEEVGDQHGSLHLYNKQKQSLKDLKRVSPSRAITEQSRVQPSQLFGSRAPARVLQASQVPIHTPMLEQFMHHSNIHRNMGDHSSLPQHNQLNVLLEQSVRSRMSDSEAFERIPTNYNPSASKVSNKHKLPLYKAKSPNKNEALHPEWKPNSYMEASRSQLAASGGGGILDQFIKRDFR